MLRWVPSVPGKISSPGHAHAVATTQNRSGGKHIGAQVLCRLDGNCRQGFYSLQGPNPVVPFKQSANSPVIRVPSATRFQSLLTFLPASSLSHFLLLILR